MYLVSLLSIYEQEVHSTYLSQVNTLYSVNIIIGVYAKLNKIYLKAKRIKWYIYANECIYMQILHSFKDLSTSKYL